MFVSRTGATMSRNYKPKDPALRGEGHFGAARRLRQSTDALVKAGIVPLAPEVGAPQMPASAPEQQDAETAGDSHPRRG
jgi:hypothetical protein